MKLKRGWLLRQFERVSKDVQEWPDWMKREAGFATPEVESDLVVQFRPPERRLRMHIVSRSKAVPRPILDNDDVYIWGIKT